LVNNPPKVAVSALVNSLKGVSSRMTHKKDDPASARNSGAARCGHRPASPGAVAVPPN